MRAYEIIAKKRDGIPLTQEEIRFFIEGYVNDNIKDYQMAAWLMAAFIRGLNKDETSALTMSMIETGKTIDLREIQGIKIDKHSTGGVGDTTTIVLGPLVASVGVPVAKLSGRGLGHTGGTLDKLESIPGFRVDLTKEQFINNVNTIGIAVMGQTTELVPSDKKMYALRDVTATVNSIPLIASSIMSKKIASGADAIVLDVKVGSGAFINDYEQALVLAREMVQIGRKLNRKTIAVISDMQQPLGLAVGNSLEIVEAINTLKGNGPRDLTELCLELGAHMLLLSQTANTKEEAKQILMDAIQSGKAINKLVELIEAQGGNPNVINNLSLLPQAKYKREIKALYSGYIRSIDAETIGIASLLLGAGRQTTDSLIDLSAGIELTKKVGDKVSEGDVIGLMYYNKLDLGELANKRLTSAFQYSSNPVYPPSLIHAVILD